MEGIEVSNNEVSSSLSMLMSSTLSIEPPAFRHCAYCLKKVLSKDAKLCGKCRRRGYCCKDCQKLDWIVGKKEKGGVGQGHNKWCGLHFGEQDLDFEVVPIDENKGLGIKALRDLPPLYRIIVEGWFTMEDMNDEENTPIIAKLSPLDTISNKVKFGKNCVESRAGNIVGLRISRANHSCAGNATVTDDQDLKVLILYCNREIKAGEEICFNYYSCNDIARQLSTQERHPIETVRMVLLLKWGIYCPDDCLCSDDNVQKQIDKCYDAYQKHRKARAQGRIGDSVEMLEKILDIMGSGLMKLKCTPETLCAVHGWIIKSADVNKRTRPIALKYAEMARDFLKSVYHPTLNKERVQSSEKAVESISKTLNDDN